MRAISTAFVVLTLAACGGNKGDDGDDDPTGPDACVGLECQVAKCSDRSLPPTTLTGTVYAPNGTLPLFGVNVYVPRDTPGPFTEGAQCSRCSDELSGSPIARVQTDDAGKFRLEGVPSGENIPLVITTGKWRRQIVIPRVEDCTEAPLQAAETRLPKNKAEGDIPKIALTTGNADSLECLVRKLGIDDAEITNGTGAGRVHFYAGNGVDEFVGGSQMSSATPFWSSVDNLKQYDIAFLSCEGAQNPNTKPQPAMDAMKAYADLGGRVFASHWHNVWVGGAFEGGGNQRPQVWDQIATWDSGNGGPSLDTIDESSNPKGNAFATWMLNVQGSTTRGQIVIQDDTGKQTATSVDPAKAERWVYWANGGTEFPQTFQFTTPNEVGIADRCGKVVFTDMHVSGQPSGGQFPNSCNEDPLTPQEKALAFMFFDIASCVGPIF